MDRTPSADAAAGLRLLTAPPARDTADAGEACADERDRTRLGNWLLRHGRELPAIALHFVDAAWDHVAADEVDRGGAEAGDLGDEPPEWRKVAENENGVSSESGPAAKSGMVNGGEENSTVSESRSLKPAISV